LVELKNISKVYGGVAVVDALSLCIPRGTCYGLLGPNGAGKSTTISMLTGNVAPDAGEVLFEGTPMDFASGDARRRYGYVPQDLAMYEELSAQENINIFGSLYGLEPDLLKQRSEKVVAMAGLQNRLKGSVREYSGGMKRRLNFALSLLHDPDLLILDEPTVGVDPQSRNLIFEGLEQLIREGKTVLYTTHYMEEVARLCTRVAIMDHGRILADDTVEGVMRLMPKARSIAIQLLEVPDPKSLAMLPQPLHWAPESRIVRIETDAQGEDMIALLQTVQKSVGTIVGVNTESPTLEQLFLYLTGRQLRD
jgi:ABC-2 type transport system ATP-binding protein